MTTIRGRIVNLKRLRNSINGNPAWQITLENGLVFRTRKDSMIAYAIDTLEYREGDVEFTLQGGQIATATPVPASAHGVSSQSGLATFLPRGF
jgi:hypothetical protein